MLPAGARLRRREDFTLVVRRGRRAGRGTLVVHYLLPPAALVGLGTGAGAAALVSTRAGFVVSRAVGGSVDRHRVVRRLRHLVRGRLGQLPAGARLVVRALPSARDADSDTLGRDLDAALDRLVAVGPLPPSSPSSPPAPAPSQSSGRSRAAAGRAAAGRAAAGRAAGTRATGAAEASR